MLSLEDNVSAELFPQTVSSSTFIKVKINLDSVAFTLHNVFTQFVFLISFRLCTLVTRLTNLTQRYVLHLWSSFISNPFIKLHTRFKMLPFC